MKLAALAVCATAAIHHTGDVLPMRGWWLSGYARSVGSQVVDTTVNHLAAMPSAYLGFKRG